MSFSVRRYRKYISEECIYVYILAQWHKTWCQVKLMFGGVQMLEKGTPYCLFYLKKMFDIWYFYAKTETSTVMNQSEAAFHECTPE